MTEPEFAAAGPVFNVGGQVARELGRDCVRLEIAEDTRGLRRMHAWFLAGGTENAGDLLHLDGSEVDFGGSLKVSLGPDERQRIAFEGTVSAIEAELGDGEPPLVAVLAEDALMKLRMTRRSRTYEQSTDADLAQAIAGEHQLQADIAADGPTYPFVQQFDQSDLAFLRERARLIQAELWCTGQTLHFRTRPRRSAPSLTLVRGADLLAVRVRADLAHQRSSVTVTGFDAHGDEVIEETAGADAVDAEISGGRTGARLVGQALGDRVSVRAREVPLDSRQARDWAAADMLRRSRAFVTVSGVTRGSPDLAVGSRLKLTAIGAPFEGGGYYTTAVRHTFDLSNGFRTRFEAERPTVNEVS